LNFSDFDFHPQVAGGITALGYVTPTPIQSQAIPHILAGRDVMGLAQTGTGKTAAFALPILQRLVEGPRGQVRALVIAPTRELAEQINKSIHELGRATGLRSTAIYGGVGFTGQVERLRRGVEIVVACPGRLLDHMQQNTIRLDALEVLVLDEADHMFDMGFLPNIRKILRGLPAQRQTLMFSATMPPDIRRLAQEVLRNPATVEVANTEPVATVTHALYPVPAHLKSALLEALLQHTDTQSVIIFTRTKHRARSIGQRLEKAGFSATSLQGNLSQNRRAEAMNGFRSGKYQIMVATDIAARGIDISQVSHVINYDIPDTAEAYTHRIGRTGRAARDGDAFTFVTREDEEMVRVIERRMNARLERRTLEGFDYHAAKPQGDEFRRTPQASPRQRPQASGREAPRHHHQPRRNPGQQHQQRRPHQGQQLRPQHEPTPEAHGHQADPERQPMSNENAMPDFGQRPGNRHRRHGHSGGGAHGHRDNRHRHYHGGNGQRDRSGNR
jgi:ATP-dependent RNA helicase RhlE